MSRWPISWMSPNAPMSPAWIEGSSSGRALFIRLARRRMLAGSATTRSPRTPSSGRPMPYRSRGSRRTWKSRISEASHGQRRATGSGARGSDGRRSPSGRRHLGRPAGLDVFDGASQQLEAGRVEVIGPRTDPFGPGEGLVETFGERLARHQDKVGGLV